MLPRARAAATVGDLARCVGSTDEHTSNSNGRNVDDEEEIQLWLRNMFSLNPVRGAVNYDRYCKLLEEKTLGRFSDAMASLELANNWNQNGHH